MILLTSGTDLLQVTTSSTSAIDAHASYVDNASGTITPGRTNTAIASIATTTVVGNAGTSQRNVKFLSLINKGGSSNTVTVKHTDGSTAVNIINVTLLANEELIYVDGDGWTYYSSTGAIQQALSPLQASGFSSAAPTGNVSTTEKAMGLGSTFTFTPNKTGNVIIWIGGVALNSTAAGDGTTITGRQGTGSAPANAATTGLGTSFGLPQHFIGSTTAGQQGFIVMGKVTGLTIGTAIWIDLSLVAVTGGGSTVKDVQCIVVEVP